MTKNKLRNVDATVMSTVLLMLGTLVLLSASAKAQVSPKPTSTPAESPSPVPTATESPEPPASKCIDHDQNKCIQVRIGVMAPRIVSDTFGKRIAENFVAIQVTVGNHDREFQYLINDVSLLLTKAVFTPQPAFNDPEREGFFISSAELSLLRGVAEKGQ